MATKKLARQLEDTEYPEGTKPLDTDEDNEDDDDEENEEKTGSKTKPRSAQKAQLKAIQARDEKRGPRERTPVIRLSKDTHDPEEDWEVEHSGTDDPDGGPPKYDESPVPGGVIIAHNFLHARKDEVVNCRGHEIDVEKTDSKGFALVKNPERYGDDEETL